MFFALGAAGFFACSALLGTQATHRLGKLSAFYGRTIAATFFLAVIAGLWGRGFTSPGLGWLLLSGMVGFGVGDLALFQALPRLGSRLSLLMTQCLAAPFAALIEWLWLDTALTGFEMLVAGMILIGVALALAPRAGSHPGALSHGGLWGVLAALGQGGGAVLSRYAYHMNTQENIFVNGWSITFQRILGGLLVVVVVWALHQTFPRWSWFAEQTRPTAPHRKPWLWSLANGLAGPTLGVACFQMALLTTPSAVVLPIAATSSLLVMPMAYHVEGDKPGWRSLLGGLMAIGGVFALIQIRS